MSTQITIGNIGGDLYGNVAGGDITFEQAIQDAPIYDRMKLRETVKRLEAELTRAVEQQQKPDDLTVKELFGTVKKLSSKAFDILRATWKNPLKGLGVALETLRGEDDDKE